MATVEWVEAVGPSVEKALEVALDELGLSSPDEADVEIIQEGQRGFLGMGGQDAIVRVKKRDNGGRERRSRGGRGGKTDSSRGSGDARSREPKRDQGREQKRESKRESKPAEASADATREPRSKSSAGGSTGDKRESQGRNSSSGRPSGGRPASDRPRREREPRPRRDDDDREDIPVEEQAAEITRFLTGLLDAFGLEGTVTSRIEDGVIYTDVVGEQTEALVGQKGAIIQAILELCRTIVQRKTMSGAKIRLDIAGYGERRREALRIYTARLADKVKAEGGEIMLEPMNAADRKVVHDAVAEIDGVHSFSEGEEPRRSVVIAKDEADG